MVFFSIGLVFWMILFTVVMYRLFFHAPLALRLTPTLFILLAPPSVGFIAYSNLVGGPDAFGHILYHTALFLALLLAKQRAALLSHPVLRLGVGLFLPAGGAEHCHASHGGAGRQPFFGVLGGALLVLTSGVIALLAARTVKAIAAGEICKPE